MTRLSQYFLPTEKQPPADAEALSHKLLVRAGMIRQVGTGLWSWLPAGWRVHQKAEQIVREELDAIGAHELLMPVAQPGRDLAALGPLRDRRAVQAQGPQGRRPRAGHDARGDRHHACRPGGALLPRPAADPLPLPDQGPRRTAPARRGAAHARVHHEGLVHVRPRPRGAGRRLREAPRGLRQDLRPLRAGVVPGRVRRRRDGRLRRARVHGAVPGGRERRRTRAGLRGERRDRQRRAAAGRAAGGRWTRRKRSRRRG